MVAAGPAPAPPAGGRGRRAGGVRKRLDVAVEQAKAEHPDRPVEVWAEDEHRLGLKPIRRKVWTPKGERPIALGHHRFEWLHVAAFVQPTSGETLWHLCS